VVTFCGRILALGGRNLEMSWCNCLGVPRGQPPWMAADKCIIRDSFRTFPLHFLSLTDTSEHAIIQAAVFIEDAAQVISLKQLVKA